MQRRLRTLFLCYMTALIVLVTSVGISMFLQHRASVQLQSDARTINQSGRQRMLSQRIIYLATDLTHRPNGATQAELAAAIAEFEAAIGLFERSHADLSQADDLSPTLTKLYFDPGDGESLDTRVTAYIDAARRIANDPKDTNSLADLRAIERAGLLNDINAIVNQYEAASIALIDRLKSWELLALAIALGIVLFEVALVFLPGHRFIREALVILEEKNIALSAARTDLLTQSAVLKDSLAESESLRREQAEFTYAISHDLKSPNNTIQLFLSEIEYGNGANLDDDGRDLLQMCMATARRMGTQVEDVLAYSGVTEPHTLPEPTDLGRVLEDVLQDLDAAITSAGATIRVGRMGSLVAHRTQMKLLLQNLIENAIKYRCPTQAPQVDISTWQSADGQHLTLVVRDNGIGIAQENQEKIFGLFQRLHLQQDYTGTGLGLCTCHRIVRNHGGTISVESTPGAGATFTATLHSLGAAHPLRQQTAA